MNAQACGRPEPPTTYTAFARCYPDADQLVRSLCVELGRGSGACGTLNPAIGYILRQRGLSTIIVTGDITCPSAPLVQHIDTGYHLWNLVSDGCSSYYLDACNPFQLWKWYNECLPPDQWLRVARGKEPAPYVPVEAVDFIWGQLSSNDIMITPGTLLAETPFFDVLEEVGKKDIVRKLFRSHGFDDPYGFTQGVLDTTVMNLPL